MNPETNQGALGSPTNAPVPTPFPEQPVTTVPPKKSHKKLIALIIAGAIILSAAIGIPVFVSNQTTKAKEAASQYRKDIVTHFDAVFAAETPKARVPVWRDTATLKDVQFGASLSTEYKDALELKNRYDSLITDNDALIVERYTINDINPFVQDLQTIFNEKLPTISTSETNLSLALTEYSKLLATVESKQNKLKDSAARLRAYVYPEEFKDGRENLAVTLDELSAEWGALAVGYRAYVDNLKERSDLDASNATETPDGLVERKDAAIAGVSAAQKKFQQVYSPSLNAFVSKRDSFLKDIYESSWYSESAEKAAELTKKITAFQDELK